MSNTLHPINTRTTFGWRETREICVKWRNFLKREGIGRWSLTMNYFLVKYIMLFERSVEDKASSSVSWIGILSGIWKQAWNSHSYRTPIGRFSLRCPTLIFFHPLCQGLPLVEANLPLAIVLSGSGSCGNLRWSTQLWEQITWPIRRLALPQEYKKEPRGTIARN